MRFGLYLAEAIARKGLSQKAFAKMVRYPQPTINGIIKSKRVPPLGRLEAWADILTTAIDRELFLELGRLEHCPPEIRALVTKLRGR
jgi:transcriptional regulator with XRE-family HTH domain